jgi:hypothetical protein
VYGAPSAAPTTVGRAACRNLIDIFSPARCEPSGGPFAGRTGIT